MNNSPISKKEMDAYAAEAEKRWGHTEIFKQSQERVRRMGTAGLVNVIDEAKKLTGEIAAAMQRGTKPQSEETQLLIAKHYDGLRAFYDPNPVIYRAMAEMYINDPRFKENYERVAPGLAQFMHDGMIFFVQTNKDIQAPSASQATNEVR